ncbi:translation initiation factor IF-2-like [Sciurus carolinensis]|uniref:translation initiation factor IF-2-like n=1 Tax=Sciurus carolinensis TaxID=30640 RepID=UPI001FB432CC|nr:translation initiation factor IF-2-like [Sciurus carolinensis]
MKAAKCVCRLSDDSGLPQGLAEGRIHPGPALPPLVRKHSSLQVGSFQKPSTPPLPERLWGTSRSQEDLLFRRQVPGPVPGFGGTGVPRSGQARDHTEGEAPPLGAGGGQTYVTRVTPGSDPSFLGTRPAALGQTRHSGTSASPKAVGSSSSCQGSPWRPRSQQLRLGSRQARGVSRVWVGTGTRSGSGSRWPRDTAERLKPAAGGAEAVNFPTQGQRAAWTSASFWGLEPGQLGQAEGRRGLGPWWEPRSPSSPASSGLLRPPPASSRPPLHRHRPAELSPAREGAQGPGRQMCLVQRPAAPGAVPEGQPGLSHLRALVAGCWAGLSIGPGMNHGGDSKKRQIPWPERPPYSWAGLVLLPSSTRATLL